MTMLFESRGKRERLCQPNTNAAKLFLTRAATNQDKANLDAYNLVLQPAFRKTSRHQLRNELFSLDGALRRRLMVTAAVFGAQAYACTLFTI